MPRVAIGVQIADGHRVDLFPFHRGDRAIERGLVERRLDAAVGAQTLANSEPQFARDELLGRRQAQIVAVVLQTLAHLDDVAMAIGCQQSDPGALMLEERVRRDSRPMHDALRLREQKCERAAEPVRQQL